MKKSDFHYDLPPALIAQAPLPERSASRLLVVPPAPAAFEDRGVRDLPALLHEGDLLVFNDTSASVNDLLLPIVLQTENLNESFYIQNHW